MWKLLPLLFLSFLAHAQTRLTFSGYVRDAASGESLPGVAVVHPAGGQGTNTNAFGFYSLTLPAAAGLDSVRLVVAALGYERQRYAAPATGSQAYDFRLAPAAELAGVEVVAEKEEKITQSTRMGTINIPVAQLKRVSALFGGVDVLKVLQLLPGCRPGARARAACTCAAARPTRILFRWTARRCTTRRTCSAFSRCSTPMRSKMWS